MRRRTTRFTIIVSLMLLLALLCGTTFALMYRQTQSLNNQFEPAVVTCAVREEFNGEIKKEIAVENTGNIDAYLRVCLVSYWVDGNGKIVSKPSQMPAVSVADGWVTGPDNTYYYSRPVSPGDVTPNLLGVEITLLEENGYLQVIEVFADAIQSKPADAVTGSWGVTLDDDQITAPPDPSKFGQ